MTEPAYCIFIDTFCGGTTPVWRDKEGKWIVYQTEAEAYAEILDLYKDRFLEYLHGERELEDVGGIDDIVCKVTQLPDGSVVDESGQVFRV